MNDFLRGKEIGELAQAVRDHKDSVDKILVKLEKGEKRMGTIEVKQGKQATKLGVHTWIFRTVFGVGGLSLLWKVFKGG